MDVGRPVIFRATAGSRSVFARVQLVRSFTARFLGLLGRKALADADGVMLAPCGSVHTLGQRFAIDVVFLDADLIVLAVTPHVRPWRLAWAPRRTCYVLELRAGLAHPLGLRAGESVALRSERCLAR